MGRGVVLLAIALLIGIVLLNATDDQPPGTDLASSANSTGSGDADRGAATTTTGVTTTTVAARPPGEVKVLVANGSDVKGAAGKASEVLKAAQYNALAPGNAVKVATSGVYFTAGYDREAAAVAAALQLPAELVKPVPTPAPLDIKTANVVVVLGGDHAPKFATDAAATTTTAAASSATTSTTTG